MITKNYVYAALVGLAIGILATVCITHLSGHLRSPWVPAPGPVVPPSPPAPPKPPVPDWINKAPVEVGIQTKDGLAPVSLMGWRRDGGNVAIAKGMKTFTQAAPSLVEEQKLARGADTQKNILLYMAWQETGGWPKYVAQQIGDCVSFGHAHANDLLQAVSFRLGDSISALRETDTEFIYGEARKVGGMLGRRDGCYGSAAVKAMTQSGMVSRSMLGSNGKYSGQRAKQWGLTGPPGDFEKLAANYKLGNAANVTTWDELVAALHAGSPVTICTGQGFTLTRDNQGFCSPQGTWGHCMFIAGVRFDRPGACVVQSWGPDMPSGPTGLGQPPFSFWVDQSTIESILAEGDSWALSQTPDFGQSKRAARKRSLPKTWLPVVKRAA